ncbi:hypothetical protein GCM10009854_03180 [Saccharopolyspora halophila]|uniref:Uncharacterized protein n=1 Tax=Saccharopolyspora halophila TaxID=405551 RepID=A0ABP5SHS7_9PSEU
MDSNALLATTPAGEPRFEAFFPLPAQHLQATPPRARARVARSEPALLRELFTQRRVIDHGLRTTTACRRAM